MSDIQRYDVDVNYQRGNWSLEEFESGDLVKYEDHAAIVTQLETELAEARKDQARYHWIQDWVESRISATPAFCKAVTRSEYDQAIDAAIKEQGK